MVEKEDDDEAHMAKRLNVQTLVASFNDHTCRIRCSSDWRHAANKNVAQRHRWHLLLLSHAKHEKDTCTRRRSEGRGDGGGLDILGSLILEVVLHSSSRDVY